MQRFLNGFQRYRQFMAGRYGSLDRINQILLACFLLVFILRPWVDFRILLVIMALALGLFLYRFLSKKIYVRSNENQRFVHVFDKREKTVKPGKPRRKAKEKNSSQKQVQYTVFHCENCGQALRAPQGKGKIKVTCQKCHHTFVKEV